MEWNLSFFLEFHKSVVIDFVEFEATVGIDLESFVELSNLIMGKFSIMSEGDGLVEQGKNDIIWISNYSKSFVSSKVILIHVNKWEMSLNAPCSVVVTLVITNETCVLEVENHGI
jgi:hypothetical protein